MSLAPGARLGPYELVSLIGSGGMGEVYKARDTRLDRVVAIKVLPEQLAADPEFRERFDREARIISQLDHPHICALYDVGANLCNVLFWIRARTAVRARQAWGWGPTQFNSW